MATSDKSQRTKPLTPEQEAARALADSVKVRAKSGKSGRKKANLQEKDAVADVLPKDKRKTGRPSLYTPEIADAICRRLSDGEPLRQICRDDGMPHWTTVYDWKDANEAFSLRFARARDIGHDAIAEDTIEMIDERPERTATEFGDKVDPAYVQWQKNRVEQRLKLLAKWSPKKYGDKVEQTLKGDPESPIALTTKVVVVPAKQAAEVETKPLGKSGD